MVWLLERVDDWRTGLTKGCVYSDGALPQTPGFIALRAINRQRLVNRCDDPLCGGGLGRSRVATHAPTPVNGVDAALGLVPNRALSSVSTCPV